jgi:uncharacterized GH25 family protein
MLIPRRRIEFALVGVVLLAGSANAHDLFFRASTYSLAPDSVATVGVLNGTFSVSENAVSRDRLSDLSLASPTGRVALDRSKWSEAEPKSSVEIATGEPGTYVLGASIHPRMLELDGKAFTAYLKEEGIEEVLALRASQNRQGAPSRERYSKYLKAILQVGDATTDGFSTALGYAAEIVPEANPSRLKAGATMTVRCIVDGKPWARKVIFAGGRRGTTDVRLPQQRLVTDQAGRATIRLSSAGTWYVKFVAMAEVSDPQANYESKWSSLSFAIR